MAALQHHEVLSGYSSNLLEKNRLTDEGLDCLALTSADKSKEADREITDPRLPRCNFTRSWIPRFMGCRAASNTFLRDKADLIGITWSDSSAL